MQANFLDAHERHWDDAQRLLQAQRWANADYLYGMAVECGLKRLMLAFGRLYDAARDRPAQQYDRVHANSAWAQTSPRSFVAAIRQAAEDSRERYPQHELALHYESIKRGIQKASEIRVQEMAEDYPWVPTILSMLRGINVPATVEVVQMHWGAAFPRGPKDLASGLPAQHAEGGWDGLRQDLERLGLMETKKDGRIDMPDLYRVGFGLGRKGGVKPRS